MYRVLIIDNEKVIADGIADIFRGQEQFDLDVYVGYSAADAVSIMERMYIDVMVTDINMPDVTGLELARIVNRRWKMTKIIFLTAYDDFDYAKTAVYCRAVGYVLKYEGEQRILEAVSHAIERIKEEDSAKKIVEEMKESILELETVYARSFFAAEFSGVSHNKQEFNDFFARMNLDFDYAGPIRMIVALANHKIGCEDLVLIGAEYIKKYLGDKISVAEGTIVQNYCIWFIAHSDIELNSFKNACFVLQQRIEDEYDGTGISFAVASEDILWSEIGNKFEELSFAVSSFSGADTEFVIDDKTKIDDIAGKMDFDYAGAKIAAESLRLSLDELNEERALSSFETVTRYFAEEPSMYCMYAVEIYMTVAQKLISVVNMFGLGNEIPFHVGIGTILNKDNFESWHELWGYIKQVLYAIFKSMQGHRSSRLDDLIYQIKYYISENLDVVQLVDLAEETKTNSSYLSRVFKEKTGIGIHDYITQKRLETARELILMSDMKMYEIAERVGYESGNYFAKVFKKSYGMLPNEYRDKYNIRAAQHRSDDNL